MTIPADRHGVRNNPPLILSYKGLSPDSELREWVAAGFVGGIVIFKDNAARESDLALAIRDLRAAAPGPFRVMIDEEGGRVRRLPDSDVSMRDLRFYHDEGPQALAAAYGKVAARVLELGIDTLLAPVVDLGSGEAGWLHSRTYSDGPQDVAKMARAVIGAVQSRGIACCGKHFPGSRGVTSDPHGNPVLDLTLPSAWESTDAEPFRAAIAAGVAMIMVGHQRLVGFDATRPACLSPLIVNILLRQRLGFAGLVLTDDLAMGAIANIYPIERAVTAALEAGCDLVLVCNDRALQRRAVAGWREWSEKTTVRLDA
ncbi:MAG: hypothetical protein HY304_07025 [candidate division Zixibacteria bacterium]|nr:hypothetical protein [candidate division Zixibacteria bacterium]